jgi:hypothetical protein
MVSVHELFWEFGGSGFECQDFYLILLRRHLIDGLLSPLLQDPAPAPFVLQFSSRELQSRLPLLLREVKCPNVTLARKVKTCSTVPGGLFAHWDALG